MPSAKTANGDVSQWLESAFARLQERGDTSLLHTYLTRDVFEELKVKVTATGSTLQDVIQSGVENPNSQIGIYAPDPESYEEFSLLFDPIITSYHKLSPGFTQPPPCFGDPTAFRSLDPEGKYVVSTRVRCARSLAGYGLNPTLTQSQYEDIEAKARHALDQLPGELAGTFYPLGEMSTDTRRKLIDEHFLFEEPDKYMKAANAARYWPAGRGIFYNQNKTLLIWVNEEDHLRIISMRQGSDLCSIYKDFVTALEVLGKQLKFVWSDKLGYLAFCPTNIGTGIRASVHIRLPQLMKDMKRLKEISAALGLQMRGSGGENSEMDGTVCDISNKRRLGCTEYEVMQEFQNGVMKLIELEKEESS